MGYVSWIGTFQGKPYDGRALNYESELVRELRELGAVLYCKTSVPHTLMGAETSNNIVGYVRLPQNRRLSPGASSGGEGALIGFRGSPAGFGTDIGGSIRHPSALNGLYGLRPSSGRSPYEGAANSMDGQNVMPSVVGPMATSASALKLLMKAVLSQQPWLQDPLVVELPWRTEMEESVLDLIRSSTDGRGKLAFGVLKHDGCVMPQPPVQRAMEYVTGLLKRLGHKVIEWEPPSHKLAAKLAFEIYGLDGGRDCFQNLSLSGESPIPQVLEPFNHGQGKQADASQIAAINIEKREFQKAYLDYWNETINVTGTGRTADALITPVIAYTAVKPHQLRYVDYSLFVNILDYPSVTVPVTRADKAIDKQDQTYRPENSQDQQVYDDYDAELYHGSPIAVQLVGRRLHEEQILTLAEYLSGLLDFH
ncbi:hypothetical protein EYZ11_005861 [Aspergillus tanneri]|nr:hypothetical protein EYZ11_005861 [Aspergillus tanneri]